MDEIKRKEMIKKLNQKIVILENKREYIKTKFYYESELVDINSAIREIKRKIKILEKSKTIRLKLEIGEIDYENICSK